MLSALQVRVQTLLWRAAGSPVPSHAAGARRWLLLAIPSTRCHQRNWSDPACPCGAQVGRPDVVSSSALAKRRGWEHGWQHPLCRRRRPVCASAGGSRRAAQRRADPARQGSALRSEVRSQRAWALVPLPTRAETASAAWIFIACFSMRSREEELLCSGHRFAPGVMLLC